MSTQQFVPYIGEYEKRFYDVLLPSGEIVKHCWPNAGWLNDVHATGRKWNPADGVKFAPSLTHPADLPA